MWMSLQIPRKDEQYVSAKLLMKIQCLGLFFKAKKHGKLFYSCYWFCVIVNRMKIVRSYKTELDPNNKQKTVLLQHVGAARYVYNWGLRKKIDTFKETGKSLFFIDLSRSLTVLKHSSYEKGGAPWLCDVSKCASQISLKYLDKAFANFCRRRREGKDRDGFPKFKTKKEGNGNFTLTGQIHVSRSRVQLPRIGHIKLKEKDFLPLKGREDIHVLSATISEKAERWYISLTVEQEVIDPIITDNYVVGVDVGIKSLAVTSEGEVYENPKAFVKNQKRLRFLQKEVDRKQKGSKNQKKARKKVSKQYKKITNIRRDNQHKASTAITKSGSVFVVESLNVEGMKSNRHLSKAVSDAGMSTFLRQLEYKSKWVGKKVIEANRWYPSSKTCSCCGAINSELGLEERIFNCPSCGFSIDRDLNAAINLKNLAGSSPVSACCPGASTPNAIGSEKTLVGQEPNTSLEG